MLTSNQISMKNTGSCLQEQDCPHLLIYLSNCILYANFKVMAYNVETLMKCTVISLMYSCMSLADTSQHVFFSLAI